MRKRGHEAIAMRESLEAEHACAVLRRELLDSTEGEFIRDMEAMYVAHLQAACSEPATGLLLGGEVKQNESSPSSSSSTSSSTADDENENDEKSDELSGAMSEKLCRDFEENDNDNGEPSHDANSVVELVSQTIV